MAGLSMCTCVSSENMGSTSCSFSHKFDGGLCCEQLHTHSHEKSISQKALDTPTSNNDNFVVEALGLAFSESLHVDTSHETFGSHLTIDQNVIYSKREASSFVLNSDVDEGSDVDKGSGNHNEISLSEEIHLVPLSSVAKNKELSSNMPPHEDSGTVNSSTRPACAKLISAMKGGRGKQGLPQNIELRVTWAPDVYDPPVTSLRTPRGSHHRSHVKKKDHHHKHKNNKSTHSRGSSTKHASRRSTYHMADSWALRPSDVEIIKHGVVNREITCGNRYYTELLANVHMPITEGILSLWS